MKNKLETIATCLGIGFITILISFAVFAMVMSIRIGLREEKERKLCIEKGGVWTYACYGTGENSFKTINVYEVKK